jgi:2,4-didehydro-3-deoxy-L-rhamnonate hydrolase
VGAGSIGPAGSERPVVPIDDTHYVDVADVVDDFDEAFFGSGGLSRLGEVVQERSAARQLREFAGERIGAPIARPHQILCIGLNYSDHAAETGAPVPDEPILFPKSPNTLVGTYDDVRIPRGSTKLDWEVELGVVIGKRTSYLDSVDDARAAIAGYGSQRCQRTRLPDRARWTVVQGQIGRNLQPSWAMAGDPGRDRRGP